ncbi:1-acyl-sn-glycerol-3-phosphate acyltransferase [Nitratireductor mangrovi]|uniref:1-acyl-sn-glycerol-3-phosphate acyltransferase n=1 Tax=Nitratireductor mangrovi TaxID=2599600 RepID=A0A5B8KX07_9HYPH|nr:1-acyl-sn-glycerol-3-phosphate acyltransferase [Nitratireductor mangrovi]QDZ00247.1 1-acyl-sn-glycerol-3-phosphate acyltransferase [Nitratireductor mangrovi]
MMGMVRAGLVLVVLIPATLLAAGVQMVALATGFPDRGLMPMLWHRMALRLVGIRLHLSGEPATDRPLLIVANHVSWTDIPVLGALMSLGFVARADMAGWPIFGFLAKLQRSIFVERDRIRTSAAQTRELGERLAEGDVMVLFAEGTTSDGNTLSPFKSTLIGAAQAALAQVQEKKGGPASVRVQPVTIAYTRLHGMPMGRYHRRHASWIGDADLIPHVGQLIREGGMDVEVHFGEPVEVTRESDRKKVTRQIEAEIRERLTQALRNPRPSSRG